jgi:hypothetical protein
MEEKFNAHTLEVEDRLNAKITHLKKEHSKKEAKWATKRQKHEEATHTLRAQVGYSEKEKGKAIEDLNIMTKQVELFENKWKGMPLLNVLATLKTTASNFNFLNYDFTVLQPNRRKPAI